MSLKGKVALVTGGSRGIGRAVCLELARQGADVAVNYAGNEAAAQETAQACRELGVRAVVLRADVADAAACDAQVLEQLGRLDILVNNAGITRDGLMLRMPEADWDAVLDTNLKGAFHCMRAAYKTMMRQKSGRVVNISSVVGLRGNAGQTNYSASKAGLIGLSKSLAKELATRNVTVNVVAPGFITTDMTDALPEGAREALLSTIPMKRLPCRKPPRLPPWPPSPWDVWARRRTWPGRWPSLLARAPAMSRARCCAWTEEWRFEPQKGNCYGKKTSSYHRPGRGHPPGPYRPGNLGGGQSGCVRYRPHHPL